MNDRQRIMVVDDDQGVLKLINHTLETEGFDTVIVADGDSALALLHEIEPDMVILDLMGPGLDSFQTLDLIREQSNVPIIMLAGDYDMDSLQKAFSLGADDYVRKPFGKRSFVARIRAKLRRTRQKV